MSETFRPDLALEVLRAHDVEFVVIGGLAAVLLGAPLATSDVDICYRRVASNLERLAGALRELHVRLRVPDLDEDLPFQVDRVALAAGDSFTFTSDAGDLDILGTPSGTTGYDDLAKGARQFDLGGGLEVLVCSLDDLIRMKGAAGRVKDKFHIELLEGLRDEISKLRGQDDPI